MEGEEEWGVIRGASEQRGGGQEVQRRCSGYWRNVGVAPSYYIDIWEKGSGQRMINDRREQWTKAETTALAERRAHEIPAESQ